MQAGLDRLFLAIRKFKRAQGERSSVALPFSNGTIGELLGCRRRKQRKKVLLIRHAGEVTTWKPIVRCQEAVARFLGMIPGARVSG